VHSLFTNDHINGAVIKQVLSARDERTAVGEGRDTLRHSSRWRWSNEDSRSAISDHHWLL